MSSDGGYGSDDSDNGGDFQTLIDFLGEFNIMCACAQHIASYIRLSYLPPDHTRKRN